jgi:rhodanese-related sulfurtransferase
MVRTGAKVMMQALLIVIASAAIAVGTNAVRSDGIELVTDVEYEIFAACKDSEAESEAARVDQLQEQSPEAILYVDARPAEAFAIEHVEGSINIPYSALFGASDDDIEKVKRAAKGKNAVTIVVYGLYEDPSAPGEEVDFAKPLAQQLVESGIAGAKHLEGGMEQLKKTGITTVKDDGATK